MRTDSAQGMFRRKPARQFNSLAVVTPPPDTSAKDILIGRLQASLEWAQKETQEYKVMMDQNALFRRVAELTNERNVLSGVHAELRITRVELLRVQGELAQLRREREEERANPLVMVVPHSDCVEVAEDFCFGCGKKATLFNRLCQKCDAGYAPDDKGGGGFYDE